jgi:hypothetical protein
VDDAGVRNFDGNFREMYRRPTSVNQRNRELTVECGPVTGREPARSDVGFLYSFAAGFGGSPASITSSMRQDPLEAVPPRFYLNRSAAKCHVRSNSQFRRSGAVAGIYNPLKRLDSAPRLRGDQLRGMTSG